jgi:hypothetical protein
MGLVRGRFVEYERSSELEYLENASAGLMRSL